jgi:cobalt-zinc-cadmium efflux system outer membrane protein
MEPAIRLKMRLLSCIIIICIVLLREAVAASPLSFKNALQIAYSNNPELQAEIDKSLAIRGRFIQSGLYPNPQLTLTGENFGGSGSYANYESAETTLSLTQPIPLGGRLLYQKKAAYADYVAAVAQIQVKKAALYIAVGVAYVDALYAGQWQVVTRKLVKLQEDIVSAIQKRMQAGAGAELDLRLAEVRAGEARIQEQKAARDALLERAKLARLLGRELPIDKLLEDKGLPDIALDWQVLAKKIINSPSLQQLLLQLQAKRSNIIAVKKAVWPDLHVQVGARHFSDDNSNAAVASTSLQVPLFDRNQGKIATAEAQYTQIAHTYQGTQLEIRQRIYDIFLQAQQSRYEADLVTASLLPLARTSIRLAQEGYQMGRYSYIELSISLNALYKEERHYQKAHADYHKTIITLAGLLGLHPTKESK